MPIQQTTDNSKVPIEDVAKRILQNGISWEKHYLANVHKYRGNEECLVDAWISHGRFSFIDLTAGPFQWGPMIGGEGVRTHTTLPRVPSRQARVVSI